MQANGLQILQHFQSMLQLLQEEHPPHQTASNQEAWSIFFLKNNEERPHYPNHRRAISLEYSKYSQRS